MSRRQSRFTESELLRAMKAAQKAGPQFAVEILGDGVIRLVQTGEKPKPDLSLSPGLVL